MTRRCLLFSRYISIYIYIYIIHIFLISTPLNIYKSYYWCNTDSESAQCFHVYAEKRYIMRSLSGDQISVPISNREMRCVLCEVLWDIMSILWNIIFLTFSIFHDLRGGTPVPWRLGQYGPSCNYSLSNGMRLIISRFRFFNLLCTLMTSCHNHITWLCYILVMRTCYIAWRLVYPTGASTVLPLVWYTQLFLLYRVNSMTK